jgi:hypothetical protein
MQSISSDLLTYRLGKMLRNLANHEAGDAISFCIVAVFSGHSRCTGRRKSLAEVTPRPHRAWVFAPSGCEPKPVRFFNRPSAPLASPATASGKLSCRTCVPAASGLSFWRPGCEPKPVRFFNRPSAPLASPATASGKLSCRTCVLAASALSVCLPGCEPKPVRFFDRPSAPLASPATASAGNCRAGPAS